MENKVYIYDSMYFGLLSDEVKVQLATLYRREAPRDLYVNLEQIQLQQGGSDCGLFAAAVCMTLSFGGDPTLVKWCQNRMRWIILRSGSCSDGTVWISEVQLYWVSNTGR